MTLLANVWNSVSSTISNGVTAVELLLGVADDESGAKQPNPAASTSNIPSKPTAPLPDGLQLRTAADPNISPGKRLKNPLGYFSSHTYQISLYMITPSSYNSFIASGRKNTKGAYLIAQSGGINKEQENRAPGFKFDYYIDNLKIETAINGGKDGGSATNSYDMSFTITEPYGFSFISRLREAANSIKGTVGSEKLSKNATKQYFIVGIRFFGYDALGNPIKGDTTYDGATLDPQAAITNSQAVFERYFDVMMTSVKFKIEGKATVYNINAAPISSFGPFSVTRGIIPKFNTTASTVGQAIENLMSTMTKQQQETYKKSVDGPLTTYKVKFIGEGGSLIEGASLVTPDDLDKYRWPGSKVTKTSQSSVAVEVRSQPDNTQRTFSFKEGISILQVIDQIISLSDYAKNSLKVLYDTSLEPVNYENSKSQDTPKNKVIRWYNCSAEISDPTWHADAKDWKYTITYLIQPYETPIIDSALAVPGTNYYGPHNRYEYWYTGKNSEILSYQQELNNAYFTVVLAERDRKTSTGGTNASDSQTGSTGADNPSGASIHVKETDLDHTGGAGVVTEAVNNYKTSLYDPSDQVKFSMQILGDPDYLCQTSSYSESTLYNRFYGTDGFSINPNRGQVFVEVNFKEAVDYTYDGVNDTNATGGITGEPGTLSINDSIMFWGESPTVNTHGLTYMVIKVVSTFSGGSFKQTISGNMVPIKNTSASTQGQGRPNQAGTGIVTKSPVPGNAKSSLDNGLKNDSEQDTANNQVATSSTSTTSETGGGSTTRYANGDVVVVLSENGPVADDDGSQVNTVTQQPNDTESNGRVMNI